MGLARLKRNLSFMQISLTFGLESNELDLVEEGVGWKACKLEGTASVFTMF